MALKRFRTYEEWAAANGIEMDIYIPPYSYEADGTNSADIIGLGDRDLEVMTEAELATARRIFKVFEEKAGGEVDAVVIGSMKYLAEQMSLKARNRLRIRLKAIGARLP